MAAGTDLVLDHADACLALSRVLAAAGDVKGAKVLRERRSAVCRKGGGEPGRPGGQPMSLTGFSSAPEATAHVTSGGREPAAAAVCRSSSMRYRHAISSGHSDCTRDGFTYDDRRRFSGDPSMTSTGCGRPRAHIGQYSHSTYACWRCGQASAAMTDAAGPTTGQRDHPFYVYEVGDDGRFIYEARFDRTTSKPPTVNSNRRYYTGEGAAFAERGIDRQWTIALNRAISTPCSASSPPRPAHRESVALGFPDRSSGEFRHASRN